jgi:hypothetical protein
VPENQRNKVINVRFSAVISTVIPHRPL